MAGCGATGQQEITSQNYQPKNFLRCFVSRVCEGAVEIGETEFASR